MKGGYYKDPIVINHDFNFSSTIYRAIKSASITSLQAIIQYIKDEDKSPNMVMSYNDLLMLDFKEIIDEKPNELEFYLNEGDCPVDQLGCYMQQEIVSAKLPKYSVIDTLFMPMRQVSDWHTVEVDVIDQLIPHQ
jgi:hypothetical protein